MPDAVAVAHLSYRIISFVIAALENAMGLACTHHTTSRERKPADATANPGIQANAGLLLFLLVHNENNLQFEMIPNLVASKISKSQTILHHQVCRDSAK